jgi:hypothetical protein
VDLADDGALAQSRSASVDTGNFDYEDESSPGRERVSSSLSFLSPPDKSDMFCLVDPDYSAADNDDEA